MFNNALVAGLRANLGWFHQEHLPLMQKAKGSSHNHQAWEGGYLDHLQQCLVLGDKLYDTLYRIEPLPFRKDSALVVLYFHDIEKIWNYGRDANRESQNDLTKFAPRQPYPAIPDWIPAGFEKWDWVGTLLSVFYNITIYDEEWNALKYIHGEGDDYKKDERVMGPLAAFCHAVDVMSARIYFDVKPGEKWSF
jgi:hypothetical protein